LTNLQKKQISLTFAKDLSFLIP